MLAAPAAKADVMLLAMGSLSGSSAGANADLSGLTGTLENGLPANVLGGIGSGITYAGGNTFYALPDRGPNATPYNSKVDDTVSYISRYQTVNMSLTATPGGSLPYSLTPTLTKTTLLSSSAPLTYGTGAGLGNKIDGTPLGSGAPAQNTSSTYYFTGRSDNFGPGNSGNPSNARLDPESIRVSPDGKSVYVSDEYGPYVRQFDNSTGKLVQTFTLPSNLDVSKLSPVGSTEISGNTSGRTANKGMEGLALTPDGKTLVGIMQAPLIQDATGASKNTVRIVTIDVATHATHEYAYNLTTGSGVSEIVALNDHQFLVDERDGKGLGDGSAAKVKQLFIIDIKGATEVSSLSGSALAAAAVTKSGPFLDIVSALGAHGIPNTQVPSKIEGLTFGQDVTINGQVEHTLWVANDNDFVPATSGPNMFYVFGFTDADLAKYGASFTPEQVAAVPEASTWAMMIAGFFGVGLLASRRRKRPALA
ncbi:esterase-like activity of phytase family protein [Bradyrhizobium manausense]|nr:esterase-like activity of phytase family protein [Bradyrhizobium manausense]MBR0725462.1 esterase-like activity of phytase family protein [Bradyrhizobium manausense]